MTSKILKLLVCVAAAAILAASGAVISAADISFTPRLTAPEKDNELYCSNFFAVYVAGMPNCTTYTYGRAWEILGHEPDLCHGRSEQWFDNSGVSSNPNDNYERGDEPRLGAIACWDMGSYGHVSVVEAIDVDTVTVSESDYMTPVYWQLSEYDKNNMGAGFQGYIYLLEQEELSPVEEITAVTTSVTTAPEIAEAITTTATAETTVTQPAVTSTAADEKIPDIVEPQNDRVEWIVTVIVVALIVLAFIVMTVTFRILDLKRKNKQKPTARRSNMRNEEIGIFLKKCHVFFIATDDDGQPRVRPFGAYLLIDGELYFMTGSGKAVYEQMIKNPRVEISGYTEGEWIRITGDAEFIDDLALRKAFVKASPKRAQMFYKMPKAGRKALLKKIPGLKNMFTEDSDYKKDLWPFRLKNATAKLYSLRNETVDLSD